MAEEQPTQPNPIDTSTTAATAPTVNANMAEITAASSHLDASGLLSMLLEHESTRRIITPGEIDYIIRDLLHLSPNSRIVAWLTANECYTEEFALEDLTHLIFSEFIDDKFPSVEDENIELSLKAMDKLKLRRMIQYMISTLLSNLNPDFNFVCCTSDDYRRFLAEYGRAVIPRQPSPPVISTAQPRPSPIDAHGTSMFSSTSHSTISAAAEQLKYSYAKRDLDAFRTLQNRNQFSQWLVSTLAQLEIQGVTNVDPRKRIEPTTADEQKLDSVNQTYVWLLLERHIKYPSGQLIVSTHSKDQNATQSLKSLIDDAGSDDVQQQNAEFLESKLRGFRADPATMKSGLEKFLDNYLRLLLQLDQVRRNPVSDADLKEWLTRSLMSHPEARDTLNRLREVEKHIAQATGQPAQPFNRTLWLSHLRSSFQATDRANKLHQSDQKERKNNKSRRDSNNQNNGRTANNADHNKDGAPPSKMSKEEYAKYTDKVKAVGMWIDPEEFKKWPSNRKAEHRRATAKKLREYNTNQAKSKSDNDESTSSTPTTNSTTPRTHGGGSMQHTLSTRDARSDDERTVHTANLSENGQTLEYKGRFYRQMVSDRAFHSSHYNGNASPHSLIDGGCNGGLAGTNSLILREDPQHTVTVTGISNNQIRDVPIVQAAEKVMSSQGPIILIMNQYAKSDQAQTIHSSIQLRDYGTLVDDLPTYHRHHDGTPGRQCLNITDNGIEYTIPLRMIRGLAHIPETSKPTWAEIDDPSIPKVHITAKSWNPDGYTDSADDESPPIDDDDASTVASAHSFVESLETFFTEHLDTEPVPKTDPLASIPTPSTFARLKQAVHGDNYASDLGKWTAQGVLDVDKLRPNFAWTPKQRIKKTLECTTQLYRSYKWGNKMKRHLKPRFPGANVKRTDEAVATDTMQWHGPPAYDDGIIGHGGATGVQLYVGKESKHIFVHPCKTDKNFNESLEEYIRKVGAPTKLLSDGAKSAVNNSQVEATLRKYAIDNGQSEADYQNQNPAEREIQDVRKLTESTMSATGTPNKYWLLCLIYIALLSNHMARASTGWRTPMEKKFGNTPDISKFLEFRWWEPVYYLESDGSQHLGRWAGVAEHVGDELTWKIVSQATGKLIYRSDVRTATDPQRPNLRAEALLVEIPPPLRDTSDDPPLPDDMEGLAEEPTPPELTMPAYPVEESGPIRTPQYTPSELVGKVFLTPGEHGGQFRTRIVRRLAEDEDARLERVRFIVQHDTGSKQAAEEIMHYNEICDLIAEQVDALQAAERGETLGASPIQTFSEIIGHDGPLPRDSPKWKGCSWNVLVQWDNEEPTWEPMEVIAKLDPISVAEYAKRNDLLYTRGWKRFRAQLRQNRKAIRRLRRMLKGNRHGKEPRFSYGVRLPDRTKSPSALDRENGNTLWADAHTYEISCYDKRQVFLDRGPATKELIAELLQKGYQRIRLIWSYAVKHDGTRRARLCAGGHTTFIGIEFTTSCSVVNLRALRTVLVLAELNGLKIMVADICSAYLMADTKELIFFIAGPEFGEREGHLMIMQKACYGLRTSGKRYHDLIYDLLTEFGFYPSLADPDVYMREFENGYEYVCVYVDDLTLAMREPEKFLDAIRAKGFDLKDVSDNPSMFLGGSVSRDADGTLVWGAQRYIKRCMEELERIYGERPTKRNVPMPESTHVELDTTPLLDETGRQRYQTLLGMLQWTITLGRFDIGCAVMCLSRFRVEPREGHLAMALHVFGYLRKYPDGAIRFRTGIPDHEASFTPIQREWERTVYGDVREQIPPNTPTPKGKSVRVSAWFDANLYHDLVTGRSAMAQLVMINQTPTHWSSKRIGSVETATYATEFIAGRVCVDEVIQTRYELRMLGAPIDGPAWMFGDNQSMVNSSMLPEGRLTKRASALSFHRVREQVAAGVIYLFHISGNINIADVMTKLLSARILHRLIHPVLFRKGETADCGDANVYEVQVGNQTIDLIVGECQPSGEFTVLHLNITPKRDQRDRGIPVVVAVKAIDHTLHQQTD